MDITKRQITKIAREVSKFTVKTMKEEGIGTAEFDFIHLIRHNPGITQAQVREALKAKGYLIRKPNPNDKRSQLLFATDKAEELKVSKTAIESLFYEWLLDELSDDEKQAFCNTLDKLYWRSKNERRDDFQHLSKIVTKKLEQ